MALVYWLVGLALVAYVSAGSLPTDTADSTSPPEDHTVNEESIADKNGIVHDTIADDGHVRIENVSDYSWMFLSNVSSLPTFQMGNFTYRIDLSEPADDDVAMNAARKRIGETPETMEKAKQELVELLTNDHDLDAPVENDAWLLRFLRSKKYKVPEAYETIKGYYKFKEENPSIYDGLLPSKEKGVAEQKMFGVLPKRDQLGRRTILFRIANWKPELHPFLDVWRLSIILAEVAAYEPATQIAGANIIFDMNGLSWQHIRQFGPSLARKVASWFPNPPLKFQSLHFVNEPFIFSLLYSFFKPFLTKDLRNRILFHGNDMESLHQHMSPSSLPDVYGGTYSKPDLSGYEWDLLLKSMDEEYAKINSYGYKHKNVTNSSVEP